MNERRIQKFAQELHANNRHIEYKLEKSPATLKLAHLSRAHCEVPRWIIVVLILITGFLIVCLLASTCLILVKHRPSVYLESCQRSECLESLGLVCVNNTCKCPQHEHYTNRCVSLSGFGQPCYQSQHCKQGLVCLNSVCDCLDTEFWNGQFCQNRLGFNHKCNQNEQCATYLRLICDQSKLVCDCSDSVTYFWNGTHCVEKESINGQCSSKSGCRESQSLVCLNTKCKCQESYYWNTEILSCTRKHREFQECLSDNECLSPMFCSANGQCKCRHLYFHNATRMECQLKLIINSSCEFTSQCRQDLGLECSSYQCKCKDTAPVWSIDDQRCSLGLDLGKSCTKTLDCNQEKNLICIFNKCECEKIQDSETYWNGSRCVNAKSYEEKCSDNIECQTLSQGTHCDETCTCAQPGGFTSKTRRCMKCKSGEIFFADSCYFISTSASKRDEAQNHCALLGGNLGKVESIEHLRFFAANLLNDYYWLSGRRRNASYYWLPSSTSLASDQLCPEFSSGTTDNYDYECLYFDSKPTTECFRPANCNNLFRYVCEII